MHPFYLNTYFYTLRPISKLPETFAIITAFATTGETWSDEENAEANCQLEAQLKDQNLPYFEVTGYSPDPIIENKAQYSEPGYGVIISLEKAIELGKSFKQDAIFFVHQDELAVHSCVNHENQTMGSFSQRIRTDVTF